jgi:hypothetical protein
VTPGPSPSAPPAAPTPPPAALNATGSGASTAASGPFALGPNSALPYIVVLSVAVAALLYALLRRARKDAARVAAEVASAHAEALAAWEKAADPEVPLPTEGAHEAPALRRTVAWAPTVSAPPTEPRAASSAFSAWTDDGAPARSGASEPGEALSSLQKQVRDLRAEVRAAREDALMKQVEDLQAQLGAVREGRVKKPARGLKLPPLRAAPQPHHPLLRSPPPQQQQQQLGAGNQGGQVAAPMEERAPSPRSSPPRATAAAPPRAAAGGGRAVLETGGRAALSPPPPPPHAHEPPEPSPPPPQGPPRSLALQPSQRVVRLADTSQMSQALLPHVLALGEVHGAATAELHERIRTGGRTGTEDLNSGLVERATALAQRSSAWMPRVARAKRGGP